MTKSDPPTANGSNYQAPGLERALIILEHLLHYPNGLGVSEITRLLGFPNNSVYRIVNTLFKFGYLNRNEDTKKYTVSRKLFSMAYGSADENNLLENSLDVMRQLRDETKETVVISIIDNNEGLILEQVQGLHHFRFVCDPGTRQDIHTSASTKAILAFTEESQCEAIIKQMKLPRLTESTITSKSEFRKILQEVHKRGFALDLAEALDGVICVAAPILNMQGEAIAAITITGPSTRLPLEILDGVGETVKKYTTIISKRIGFINKDAAQPRIA